MPMSEDIFTQVTDAYRRIRNTVRFLLGNLYDFDPATDSVAPGDMLEADRWASFTEDPKSGPDWPAAVELWRASGRWPKSLGPPPDHPETQVPETLRAA
jgi:hypothetical protein